MYLHRDLKSLKDFYKKQLLNDTIPFWFPRSFDEENGGFLFMRDADGSLIDHVLLAVTEKDFHRIINYRRTLHRAWLLYALSMLISKKKLSHAEKIHPIYCCHISILSFCAANFKYHPATCVVESCKRQLYHR
jgi:hypothetical protein